MIMTQVGLAYGMSTTSFGNDGGLFLCWNKGGKRLHSVAVLGSMGESGDTVYVPITRWVEAKQMSVTMVIPMAIYVPSSDGGVLVAAYRPASGIMFAAAPHKGVGAVIPIPRTEFIVVDKKPAT